MSLNLDTRASALVKDLQRQTGVLKPHVEQALVQACQAQTAQAPLNADQVEKILLQAMPEQQQAIQSAVQSTQRYQGDKVNGRFLTQILDTRIVKEFDHVHRPPTPTAPIARDPLIAQFTLDPKADFMLLFNARDVDRNGQPLLMKVVVRERADISKLDLSRYRTQAGSQPDIVKVPNNATFVETKDINETEFNFGDPLKQVSLNNDGKELSTSVKVRPQNVRVDSHFAGTRVGNMWVPDKNRPIGAPQQTGGEQLDQTPVVRFDDRISLHMNAKATMPQGAWLDTAGGAAHVDTKLNLDRGFIFEPGSKASVSFLGAKIDVAVPADDAHLLGSASGNADVPVSNANWTLRQLLTQAVQRGASANPLGNDTQNVSTAAHNLIFARAADLSVGAGKLQPLGDTTVRQGDFAAAKLNCEAVPLSHPNNDGMQVTLSLGDGFLAAANDASVKGWKVVAGYNDESGQWKEASAYTVGNDKQSANTKFTFDVPNADEMQRLDKQLEVRVFNESGVPAQRLLVPFREIGWASGTNC